jgi:hypothetical protein
MESTLCSPERVHTAFPVEARVAFPREGLLCVPPKGSAPRSPREVRIAFPREGLLCVLPSELALLSPVGVGIAFPREGLLCFPQWGPQRSTSATLVEFILPSTHKPKRVHSSPAYLTGYVPSTGFLTLSTACSSPERPALFHAGNAHGILLSRGFPSLLGSATRRHENTLLAFLHRIRRNK